MSKPLTQMGMLQEFILWARKERIQLAHVRIGEAEATLADPAAVAIGDRDLKPEKAEPRASIYQEFSGGMLDASAPVPKAENEPTEEDEDE